MPLPIRKKLCGFSTLKASKRQSIINSIGFSGDWPINEDLDVRSELDFESIFALILTYSPYPHYKPVPNVPFFRKFPNLKSLVLQRISLNKNTILVLSEINPLLFVYLYNCITRELGSGPFETFESCGNQNPVFKKLLA